MTVWVIVDDEGKPTATSHGHLRMFRVKRIADAYLRDVLDGREQYRIVRMKLVPFRGKK